MQSTLAPPPVIQAPPPTESVVEPELVGDNDGTGLAIGLVSQLHVVIQLCVLYFNNVCTVAYR